MGTRTTGMTVAEAVELVNEAIADLAAGPERVTAVDPAQVTVDWDARPAPGRRPKMNCIVGAVNARLHNVRHQMPDVFLVADDGVVTGIFRSDFGIKVA